jgi:hypothetical protein
MEPASKAAAEGHRMYTVEDTCEGDHESALFVRPNDVVAVIELGPQWTLARCAQTEVCEFLMCFGRFVDSSLCRRLGTFLPRCLRRFKL